MKKLNQTNKKREYEITQSNNSVCYIVGAGVLNEDNFPFVKKGLLIAADGGYSALKKSGIIPDYIVGDFDSLEEAPEEIPTEVYCKEKDETDMMIAVNKGFSLDYHTFVIYGGLGGRIEHSMANIQLLNYIVEKGGRGYLIQGENILTVISNEEFMIKAQDSGYVSVFSLRESSSGVTLKGLKYLLNDSALTSTYPIGVSNEFIGENVFIKVKNGTLMISWRAKNPEQSLFTESF